MNNVFQIVRDLSVVVNINESAKITKLEVPDLKLDNDVAADLEKKRKDVYILIDYSVQVNSASKYYKILFFLVDYH